MYTHNIITNKQQIMIVILIVTNIRMALSSLYGGGDILCGPGLRSQKHVSMSSIVGSIIQHIIRWYNCYD